jgi:phosphate transport system substrate-binding protein
MKRMKNKLIIVAGVALALSLGNLQAQNAPAAKRNGQGTAAINQDCPQPDCPLAGQGPCGQGGGKGQGMGKGARMGKGQGMGQGKCGQGLRKGPANGMGNGQCLRDGTGPNCTR